MQKNQSDKQILFVYPIDYLLFTYQRAFSTLLR